MTGMSHTGGGILVAAAVQRIVFQEEITPSTIVAGALMGVLPDLDILLALIFGKWTPGKSLLNHHRYITHTPLIYLIASLILYWLADWKIALLFGSITLSHLVMDSWGTDDGIMWLWPLRHEQYSLYQKDLHAGGEFGLSFYRSYFKTPSSWIPELLAVLGGASVLLSLFVTWGL
jgi:membrane-bound metal-dependent hydrolase YbcI (DUF457 family)